MSVAKELKLNIFQIILVARRNQWHRRGLVVSMTTTRTEDSMHSTWHVPYQGPKPGRLICQWVSSRICKTSNISNLHEQFIAWRIGKQWSWPLGYIFLLFPIYSCSLQRRCQDVLQWKSRFLTFTVQNPLTVLKLKVPSANPGNHNRKQRSFWVWAQPMRYDVTMQRRLSLAKSIPRMIPAKVIHEYLVICLEWLLNCTTAPSNCRHVGTSDRAELRGL